MNLCIKRSVFIKIIVVVAVLITGCSESDNRTDALLEQGIKYLDDNKLREANKFFKGVLVDNANMPEPYFYLGKIADSNNKKNKALTYYKKAITLDPKYIDARIELGILYAARKSIALAQKQVDEVFIIDKNNLDVRVLQAVILYAKGETNKFSDLLHIILKAEPGNLQAAKLLSAYYLLNDKENEALEVLEDVNTVSNGSDKNILKQIMLIYSNRKETSSAERVMLQHIDRYQGDIEYYSMVVNFYGSNDRLDEAEKILRSAIEVDPENISQYQLLSELYKSGYGLKKALKEMQGYVKVKPEIIELRLILAQLYAENDQAKVAEKIYQSVIEVDDPKIALAAKLQLATISRSGSDYSKANKYINEILNEDPSNYSALMLRGKIAMLQNDLDLVLNTMSRIVEIQPGNKYAHVQKAILLEQLDKPEEALQVIETVLNMDANFSSALSLKNRILEKKKILVIPIE